MCNDAADPGRRGVLDLKGLKEMNASKSVSWIDDGEKYALIGLSVKTEGNIPHGIIAPRLWVVTDTRFEFPSHWKNWLGTTRSEEVEGSNLFLLSKIKSEQPDSLDRENQTLQHWVSLFTSDCSLRAHFQRRTSRLC
jgi:hypothetical protein